jgi:hypothetical protein
VFDAQKERGMVAITYRKILVAFILIGILSIVQTIQAQSASESTATKNTKKENSHFLPLFKKDIPEEYRKHVPLPIGISFNYVHQVMPLDIIDAKVEIPGMPLPSGFVRGGTIKPYTDSYVARLDAWLLPFLNVYGTAGRFTGDAKKLKFDLAAPVALPIPSQVSYSGSSFGFGLTGAFAYRAFFASYDVNWNWAKPDVTNRLRVTNQGPRLGVLVSPLKIQCKIYGGAYRTSISGGQRGTVTLESGIPITFDIKVHPVKAWSPLFGSEISLTRHIVVGIEGDVGHTKQLVLTTGYRF